MDRIKHQVHTEKNDDGGNMISEKSFKLKKIIHPKF